MGRIHAIVVLGSHSGPMHLKELPAIIPKAAFKAHSLQGAKPLQRHSQEDQAMRVKKVVTINRSPAELYEFWHNFENLPRFMRHLESVQVTGNGRSHWKVKAPAGQTVEWDAQVTEDEPNKVIGWHSLEGADVPNSGTVRFTPATGGRGTWVQVDLDYDPPAGKAGALVAKLFGEEPDKQLYDDLHAFKQVMELGEVVLSEATIETTHLVQRPGQPPEKVPATAKR